MSDEEDSLIQDVFLTKLGSKHPWVKAKSAVDEKYGVTGFPTVVVVDAHGNVAFRTMPGEAEIERLLQDVRMAPKMPDEPRYAPLRALWEKGEHAKLREQLDKLLADGKLEATFREQVQAQRDELQKRLDRAVARAEELGGSKEYASAQEKLQRLEKQWRGLPPAEAAKKALAQIAADPAAKKELAAAKSLARLRSQYDPSRVAQRRKLAEELQKFAKQHAGTQAAAEAEAEAKRLSSGD